MSLKAIYVFVLNISQAHCCLFKQRPGVQLSTCHAVLIESKFVLPLLFLLSSAQKNIMGEKHFLDSLNIPCVTALWQSSVCKRHDSRRDPPALGCTVKEKCYLLFCPDGFGTGKIAMKFQRVAAIPLSISLPCSTVHS